MLAKTQLDLLKGRDTRQEVVPHGDFENVVAARRPPRDDLLNHFRWQRVKDMPSGFAVWSFTGRPARFVWTDKLAHSGNRCLGIEENEVRGSILRHVEVKPKERYRVSVYATRTWTGKERDIRPALGIAWQARREGKSGWTSDPRLTITAEVKESGQWQELVARVTVPNGATTMVVFLSIDGSQIGNGGTYFDDLHIVKTHDPEGN